MMKVFFEFILVEKCNIGVLICGGMLFISLCYYLLLDFDGKEKDVIVFGV